ncbi:MAG: ATP-binding cassette domain-containing protein [Boseongicola sp. SB0670_bin_30]|nr:ATP-binding cassette domain-containing protein [Boseongicola sp. SB0670_bin_30]
MTPPTDRRDKSGEPLLSVEGLSKTFHDRRLFSRFRGAGVRAVDSVSFSLDAGETLGVVGETGSGKSTLGRLVLRLVEPSAGRIRFNGEDITALSQRQIRGMRQQVQMIFQDPYGSLDPRMSVGSIVAEPMIVHGLWRGGRDDRVLEVMRQVGLQAEHRSRYPHEFSGGQRQRIGIARAMALQPKLLVLDEPVSALDVSIQAQIINLLRDLQQQADLGFLFIAHDLAVVRHVSNRVAVMYLGEIVEIGPRDALYASPMHPYTVSLLSAVPVPTVDRDSGRDRVVLHGEIGSATNLPSGCRFHPRCYKARLKAENPDVETVESQGERLPAACVMHRPRPVDAGDGHVATCHFPERGEDRSQIARHAVASSSGAG